MATQHPKDDAGRLPSRERRCRLVRGKAMRLCVIVTLFLLLTISATLQRSEAALVKEAEAFAGLSSEAFGGLSVIDRHIASDRASAHVVPGYRVGPGSADAAAEFGGTP